MIVPSVHSNKVIRLFSYALDEDIPLLGETEVEILNLLHFNVSSFGNVHLLILSMRNLERASTRLCISASLSKVF